MTFENTIARYRKVSEHLEELKDIVDSLKAEREALEASVIDSCLRNESLFNVFMRKTSSAGLVGRNYFQVSFSKKLQRSEEGDRLDEQDWLAGLAEQYVKTKLSISASKVRADYSAKRLDDKALRDMGLKYGDDVSLSVKYIPDEATLAQIKRDAEELAGEE